MPHLPLTILSRQAFIQDELNASAETKKKILDQCTDRIIKAVDLLIGSLNNGGKIMLCGNGGSASDAQHLATELIIRMNPAIKRPSIPAIALNTDTSMLTAGANDIGYDNVFARAVEGLGRPGDVLIGLSTSGKSESINRALTMARTKGITTIALLGRDGGTTKDLVDLAIIVPSSDTARIQEGHITIGHIICALIEREMYA
jgi:D-sedoheptulose 7-phosphate isomerase